MDGMIAPPQVDRESISRSSVMQPDEMMLVTLKLGQQLCGVPVQRVMEVLSTPKIANIPLAPPDVSGCLNLRGRVVTAIDVRTCVAMPSLEKAGMALVTERGGELFALIGDEVADVMSLPSASLEPCPPTLAARWAQYSTGVCRLADRLLVVLDIDRLLGGVGA